MKLWSLVLICLSGWVATAAGQTVSRPATTAARPPSTSASAGIRTHLQALHYKNIRDLRRGPDGRWTGKATRGNVPKTVTIAPDGTVTAR